MKYKTIVINLETHKKLKKFCVEKNLKINEYVNNLIEEQLLIEENSELPLILKNSNGDIVETIICNDISSEIKNNMPKSITLKKTTKDGSGYIGNYTIRQL